MKKLQKPFVIVSHEKLKNAFLFEKVAFWVEKITFSIQKAAFLDKKVAL